MARSRTNSRRGPRWDPSAGRIAMELGGAIRELVSFAEMIWCNGDENNDVPCQTLRILERQVVSLMVELQRKIGRTRNGFMNTLHRTVEMFCDQWDSPER